MCKELPNAIKECVSLSPFKTKLKNHIYNIGCILISVTILFYFKRTSLFFPRLKLFKISSFEIIVLFFMSNKASLNLICPKKTPANNRVFYWDGNQKLRGVIRTVLGISNVKRSDLSY